MLKKSSSVMGNFDWPITKGKENQAFGQPQNRYVVISSFGLIDYKRVKLRAKHYRII
jgi:hypothetical protein